MRGDGVYRIRALLGDVIDKVVDDRIKKFHGQTLAALGMNIASVQAEIKPQGGRAGHACRESLKMIKGLTQELRTISYLLHPPLLEEAGLPAAVRWYAQRDLQ